MKAPLLDMLVDPASGEPLTLEADALVSPSGARYEIRDGIARLADPAGSGQEDAFDTFSWKWTHLSPEQIDQRVAAQYAPVHASRHTPEEVQQWCARAGLDVDRLDVGDAAISVLARRPG